MKWFRYLAGVLLLSPFAACGGGEKVTAAHPLSAWSKAADSRTTLDVRDRRFIFQESSWRLLKAGSDNGSRRQALAVSDAPAAVSITVDQLFNWAEATYPDLFPAGPLTVRLSFDGKTFDARSYPNGNALGVTLDGTVYIYGPFTATTTPLVVGVIGDYVCQVTPSLCNGETTTTDAGILQLSQDSQVLIPANGKWRFLGAADGSSHEVTTADVAKGCWNSNRVGWQGKSQACSVPAEDGAIWFSGKMPNNDRGLVTLYLKDGTELWLDFSSAGGWKLSGDLKPRMTLGKIDYGNNGYQPARVSVVREPDNTITLTVDSGSDYVTGYGLNGEMTVFNQDTEANPLMFAVHSDKSGANQTPGWGLGPTATSPTVHTAWMDFDKVSKKRVLTFRNMACADQVSITVYKHLSIVPAADGSKQVTYDYGANGFGAGWFIVPGASDSDPLFQAGPGVIWDSKNFRITWSFPLCKVKTT